MAPGSSHHREVLIPVRLRAALRHTSLREEPVQVSRGVDLSRQLTLQSLARGVTQPLGERQSLRSGPSPEGVSFVLSDDEMDTR